MADDYFSWSERHNRPAERIRKALEKRDLERTQPIQVQESDLSDTSVTRVRSAIVRKRRGDL
jgi:hypothetical protein